MKFLSAIGAAITVTLAAFASPVFAEPSQESDNFYVLGATEEILIMGPTNIETKGFKVQVWSLQIFGTPAVDDNGAVAQGFWALSEFDCSANTHRLVRAEVVDENFEVIANLEGQPVSGYEEGSMMDGLADLACNRAKPDVIPIEKAAQLANAFIAYHAE